MKIIPYLQKNKNLPRRSIVDMINNGQILLNWQNINSYVQELRDGDLIEIKKIWIRMKVKKEFWMKFFMVVFNKPKWYVVSKSDKFNKTIYDILPKEFRNYYYIWRLDKDSHWLLLLTNNSKLVDFYESPKNNIEKEYIVKIDKKLLSRDRQQIVQWIQNNWEFLRVLRITDVKKWVSNVLRIFLNEWKKRHIRRIFESLWYKVLDLQRIKEWEFILGKLPLGKCIKHKMDNK